MNLLLLGFPVLNFASREVRSEDRQLPLDIRRIELWEESSDRCLATAKQFRTREDRRNSVAATVQEDPRLAQPDSFLEATGLSRLTAQSPSERWDGDYVLRYPALDCFSSLFGGARQRCDGSGSRRTATEGAYSPIAMSTQIDRKGEPFSLIPV